MYLVPYLTYSSTTYFIKQFKHLDQIGHEPAAENCTAADSQNSSGQMFRSGQMDYSACEI